jgi:RimJ/RimL family protein N-acetyltransferase
MYDEPVNDAGTPKIVTPRLDLVAITPEALRSELAADGRLGEILGCRVTSEWPHADWEPHVFELLLTTFAEHPEDIAWHRYILLRSQEEGQPVLIGTTGAFRWAAKRSEAEFGYAIVSEFRLRGYATEAARAMLAWIEATEPTVAVMAHTYPELTGSIRILEHCGFTLEGPGAEPRTLRFVRPQATQHTITSR